MELYNSTITGADGEARRTAIPRCWGYEPSRAWKDLGQNELVLTRDAAYELGGGSNPGLELHLRHDGRERLSLRTG